MKWIVSAVKAIFKWLGDLFDGVLDWIIAIIIIIVLIVISYYTGYGWEYIGAALEWVMGADTLLAVTSWLDVAATVYELAGLWNTIVWVGGQLVSWIGTALSTFGSWLGTAWSAIGGWAGAAASTVWDVAKAVGGAASSAASWVADLLSDNPGLLALGAAHATGLLDWLMDNWPIVAAGVVAYFVLSDDGSKGSGVTINNGGPYAYRT